MNSSRAFIGISVVALIAYSILLQRNIAWGVGGADASGYMNEAKLFGSGNLRAPIEPLQQLGIPSSFGRLFIPIGWGWAPDRRFMVPTYPAGAPLHFAVAALIGGWNAPFYVSPLAGLGAIVLLFLIGRELGLSRWWSLAAAAIFACVPIFFANAVQPLSDALATFWALAAMWCALRSRTRPYFAIAAGAALAIGVCVRPTNLLIGFPLLVAMRFRWNLIARAVLAAIPFGLALMWLHWNQFGSPFTTGYGTLGQMLNVKALSRCPKHHLLWMVRTLTPIIPLAALAAIFIRGIDKWARILVPVWFSVFFAFYSFYDVCIDWWDLRFIMPALPAVILGGVLTLSYWRMPRGLAVVLVLAVLVQEARVAKNVSMFGYDDYEQIWPNTVHWAEKQLPRDALVISGIYGGAFYYYAQRPTVRWELMTPDDFQLLRAYAGNAGLPWYAVISKDADTTPEEFVKKFPGKWTVLSKYRDVTLWRLDE